MIGGEPEVVERLEPLFATLAPGPGLAEDARTQRSGGNGGAGLPALRPERRRAFRQDGAQRNRIRARWPRMRRDSASCGTRTSENGARQATPRRRRSEAPRPIITILDLADIAEVWRRGSVVASWLLDLTAAALARDAGLETFAGRVSDSGEGRWTLAASIDESVPACLSSPPPCSSASARAERRASPIGSFRRCGSIRRPCREAVSASDIGLLNSRRRWDARNEQEGPHRPRRAICARARAGRHPLRHHERSSTPRPVDAPGGAGSDHPGGGFQRRHPGKSGHVDPGEKGHREGRRRPRD